MSHKSEANTHFILILNFQSSPIIVFARSAQVQRSLGTFPFPLRQRVNFLKDIPGVCWECAVRRPCTPARGYCTCPNKSPSQVSRAAIPGTYPSPYVVTKRARPIRVRRLPKKDDGLPVNPPLCPPPWVGASVAKVKGYYNNKEQPRPMSGLSLITFPFRQRRALPGQCRHLSPSLSLFHFHYFICVCVCGKLIKSPALPELRCVDCSATPICFRTSWPRRTHTLSR